MASPNKSVAVLLQALSQANNLWELHPPPPAAPALSSITSTSGVHDGTSLRQQAELLRARLDSWLAPSAAMPPASPPAMQMNGPRLPLSLDDLPVMLLVHALTFLVPAKPGLTSTYQTKWADVGAFSSVSHKVHAAARDDVFWKPVCEQLWGSVADPRLRALWRVNGWAALYQRMARSSICVEHSGGESSAPGGGYRLRWKDDYVLIVELRDIHKGLVLFSEWGPLWYEAGDWMDPSRTLTLRCEFDATGERTSGCAAWIDAELATRQHKGVVVARLLKDHPALRGNSIPRPYHGRSTQTMWDCVDSYFRESVRRADVRLEVRLLHVPSSKAATLYSAQHDDFLHFDTQGDIHIEAHDLMMDPSGMQGSFKFAEMVVRLPHGAEKIRVQGDLQVRMTAADDDMDTEDGWLDKTRIGIGKFHVNFTVGGELCELGSDRLLYRLLQALPWTS